MRTFRAMTTDVVVAAPALDDAAEHALAERIAAVFADTERRFSRFRPDSELSRLNRATGAVTVSRELIALLGAARRHVAASDGWFDPAIGGALCAAGYDRSFSDGALDRDAEPRACAPARFTDLVIDERRRRVVRPPALQIDLGGFLKGHTADRAAALAQVPCMVDAGGDAVLRGAGPDGQGWLVDVEDPADPRRSVVTLRVRDGAVATSAANRRRWRAGAIRAHHLIDPRTGAPARSDLAQATVLASRAEQADVLAKVAFLRGAAGAVRMLDGQSGIGGVLVSRDGSVRLVGDLEVARA